MKPRFVLDSHAVSDGAFVRPRKPALMVIGETQFRLTAGWPGLLAAGASHWLAVEPLWRNEAPLYAAATSTGGNGSGVTGLRYRELPTPKMGLKPRLSREVRHDR